MGKCLMTHLLCSKILFKQNWIQHWRRGELPEAKLTFMLLDPAGKKQKVAIILGWL